MKQQKTLLALALIASAAVSSTAQASLYDRGNGLLYDDVLDVTWLQDANYARTSGYALANSDGEMDWDTAKHWAADLVYGGYSDWRLASNTPVDGSSFNVDFRYDGSTDWGYNITSPHSELAYMYHVNLGLKDYRSTTGAYQSDYGIFGDGTYDGPSDFDIFGDNTVYYGNNVGLVNNLRGNAYWSGAEYTPGVAWEFDPGNGDQDYNGKSVESYAWAVRPGDVSAVPVPGAVWLFGSGLLGLLGFKKRKAA